MQAYIIRRGALSLLVLMGVSVVTFIISHIIPGDPAAVIAGFDATPETIQAIREKYGLDRPLPEQYILYVRGLLSGDLGTSMSSLRPVASDLRQYLPATIELTLGAAMISLVVGLPLGMVSALRSNQPVDHVARVLSIFMAGAPVFWAGLILQLVFFKWLHLLPATGRLDVGVAPPPRVTGLYTIDSLLIGDLGLFIDAVRHLILPSWVLSWSTLALLSRTLRSTMLEVTRKDYVRTAVSKGLTPRQVTLRHVLPNSLIPVVTLFGTSLCNLLAGAVVTETIFSFHGIGYYVYRAIVYLDVPSILGITTAICVLFVLMSLVVDLMYPVLDPRIRYG